MAEREIVLLSGMHRSGTSALARVFNLLGATLPEPLVPASLGNELGHWEPAEAVAMNDAALLAAGSDVNSLHPLSPEWAHGGGGEAFIEEVRAWLERVAAPGVLTVVKDPRISLLAPFWRAAVERLGARPRFVVSWRDPWEVARSLSRRQLEHFPEEVWPHARVELLWLRHQLELERASRGALRSFAAYASLLEDWRPVVTRLFTELELTAPQVTERKSSAVDAFLRPEARRQRRPAAEAPSSAAADVLKLLEARVGRPQGGAQAFDRAASRFDDAVRLLGDYLAALETRVATDAALTGEAGEARVLVEALREAVQAAELRAAEAQRRAAAQPVAAPAPAELADLRSRHLGLQAAHEQMRSDLRTAQGLHAGQARDAETRLAAVRAQAREAERRLRPESDRADRAEADAKRALEEAGRLRGEADRLKAELEDHRSAYEALRLEAAAARAAAAQSERLRSDGSAVARTQHSQARADTRSIALLSTEAAALRDEMAALRASASWRVTRPVRSVAFRLRRLVRR